MAADTTRVVEAIWRMEAPRLVAAITRVIGDVGQAEELAQDALVAALEQWPQRGVPERPAAWLMTTAKHKAIDRIRREVIFGRKQEEMARTTPGWEEPDWEEALSHPVADDILRLIFVACHPVLSREARVALTLKLLGGLSTQEIARAFLVKESTIAQRIVRAKKTLAREDVEFELPPADQLVERLTSVLEVIYLIFNEGYAPSAGESWVRADLCHEALRLGRVLAELAPEHGEVHGLVALMEFQASRLRARFDRNGRPMRLEEQERARWDRLLIGRGMEALERARALDSEPGSYRLQAEIAACHARAPTVAETDWEMIAALYDRLSRLAPSPVIELNRAMALGMAYGPEVGLKLIDQLIEEPKLAGYHFLFAAKGDLLERAGRTIEARELFHHAAGLTANRSERRILLERAKTMGGPLD